MATNQAPASPGMPSPMPPADWKPAHLRPAPIRELMVTTVANGFIVTTGDRRMAGHVEPSYVFTDLKEMAEWIANQVWEMRK